MPPLAKSFLDIGRLVEGISTRAPIGSFRPTRPSQNGRLAAFVYTELRVSRATRWQEVRHQSTTSRAFSNTARSRKPAPPPPARSAVPRRSNAAPLLGMVFGASALAFIGTALIPGKEVEVEENPIQTDGHVDVTETDDGIKKFRLSEVTKHDRNSESKWIIRGTGVYDITEFVESHPGGEIILRACGGSIDPYWKMFSIHNKPEVYDILKQYYIGEIDDQDLDDAGNVNWKVLGDEAASLVVDDLFQHDPKRDESLIYRTEKPCNAETPGNLLTDFLTPLRLFFVRNHFWVPRTEEAPHALNFELSDGEEKSYSLEDLKTKFKQHTITVTLQCSGNRRSHMNTASQGKTSGLAWDIGAIGTAEFTGVRLRDVLRDAGHDVDDDCPAPKQCECEEADKHVHFISPADTYAVSIPLQTAVNPQADVLLAWDMNGEPITRDHGGPIRAIVPGTTAARSVKWLGKISISCDESPSQWQQRDYKCFGPNVTQKMVTSADWEEGHSMQETPVQSAITKISKASEEKTTVQGFAFSGGGRDIIRVDVSADGGKTWRQAELQQDRAKGSKRWAWTLWSIQWPKDELKPGQEVEFVCKATDEAYGSQPETFDSIWNLRGLCANAWDRKKVAVEDL